MKPKLLGIGSGLLDRLAYVPEDFVASIQGEKGGMELIDKDQMDALLSRLDKPTERAPGGSAANAVVGFAQLGGNAAFLTKMGDDEEGKFYQEAMGEAGVDTAKFKINPAEPTGTCLSFITPDAQRTMRTFLGAAATLAPEDLTAADFKDCTHLYLEGYLLFNRDLLQHILQAAKEAGCKVSIDLAAPEVVEGAMDILPDWLEKYVDIVLSNEDEAAVFSNERDEDKALRCLGSYCETAVVKLGARGAYIQSGEERVQVDALRVEAHDTTGAGDLWGAGFVYGLTHGMALQDAGRLGARLGAEVVQLTGAALPADKWKAIREEFGLA